MPRTRAAAAPRKRITAVPPLAAGARVALVAPAGGLRGKEDTERAERNARSLGWDPVLGKNALKKQAYFAGSDAERLSDLNEALRDRNIDGIWCIRGGYGMMRLLPEVDFDALCARPRPVIGFSDLTALHCGIQKACGIVSYHGPVARTPLSEFSRRSLARAAIEQTDSAGAAKRARTIRPGKAEGVLAGGNLAVLAALVGTPFAPKLRGAIVLMEDISERMYRLDRMIRQLLLSGILAGARAIVFGQCVDCGDSAESGGRSIDDLLGETADVLGIPCLAGVPVGHIEDQWTLPLGRRAYLDAEARTLSVATS
jgi:muramoyltetrapeptide carboxypeptidase